MRVEALAWLPFWILIADGVRQILSHAKDLICWQLLGRARSRRLAW